MKNRTCGMNLYVKCQKTQTQVTFKFELFPVVINWEGSNQASITRAHMCEMKLMYYNERGQSVEYLFYNSLTPWDCS